MKILDTISLSTVRCNMQQLDQNKEASSKL